MIARSWRATATPEGASRYQEHFRTAVLPELRAVPGFRMAYLMRRGPGDGASDGTVQIQVLTLWESLAAIAGFAGDTPQAAVVDAAAQATLVDFDRTVAHYEAEQHPA